MPSPLPGMDPYLEAADLWPDVHQRLATEISNELNARLPARYYARLETRSEVGLSAESFEGRRGRVTEPLVVESELVPHRFIEVRDAERGHALVTLIEILSPANKRPGPSREAYRRKQREILGSAANLVEIDLLRAGRRVPPDDAVAEALARLDPAPDYLVLVNQAWRRTGETVSHRLYPVGLREWLPCVGVPLTAFEPEVPLDLQFVLQRIYDQGPYGRGLVDYARPPVPPLAPADAAWAARLPRLAGNSAESPGP